MQHIDRIPKFLLDVDCNPWRTATVQERFAEFGLAVERFSGVQGQQVGITPARTVWDNPDGSGHPYRINPGKLSITLNKLMLFQHIVDLGHEEAIIFENDVKFVRYFREEFETSYNALPADWEAVHIGHCCAEGRPMTIINNRVQHIAGVLCCHALMFKRSALLKAIDILKHACWGTPSDTILQRKFYPNVVHYCFVPQLAFQDASDSEAAKTEVYLDHQGWYDFDRLYREQVMGAGDRKCTFVEVGTWLGRSAIDMASEIKRQLRNVDFYCVDTWEGNPDEPSMQPMIAESVRLYGSLYNHFVRNINRCGVADVIKPIQKTSVEAAKDFANESVDFCFIDAGHDYDSVLSDCRSWYSKMRPGGCLAGHDANRKPVRDAVEGFCREVGKKPRYYRQYENGESVWIIDRCHNRDE